jgi:4-amino-4-deoxy-L-arabinose transferase-like glycosyltransferase
MRWYLRRRHVLLGPIGLVALWLPGIWQGWLRTDSHYYAAIGLQAWRTGELWALHAGDAAYLNKPPVAFWVHGFFLWILGPSVWAARLPSLLAAIGACLAITYAVRVLSTRKLAMITGLILASTIEFFRYTRAISLDSWLVLALAACLACAAAAVGRAAREDSHADQRRANGGRSDDRVRARPRRGALILLGLPLAIGLLTKPFVALLAPLLIAAWLLMIGRASLLPRLAAGTLIGIALALPWHLSMESIYPGIFWNTYLFEQSLERAVESTRPWWYYLRIMTQTYWPWLALLGAAVVTTIIGRAWIRPRFRSVVLLAALWALAWLLVLSFFGGKAGRYAMPMYLTLGVPAAAWMLTLRSGRRRGRVFFAWIGPVGIALCTLACALILSVNLRVHGPRFEPWDDLVARLNAQHTQKLFTSPRANFLSANVYLLNGDWPTIAALPTDTRDAKPPGTAGVTLRPGDWVLLEHAEPDWQQWGDQVMDNNAFRIVRVR